MTTIAVIVTDSAVVVASDGAGYGPEGTLQAITSKVLLLPEASTILAFRAPVKLPPAFYASLKRWRGPVDFDLIIGNLPLLAREADHFIRQIEPAEWCDFEVVAAGWSEVRGRHEAWSVKSFGFEDVPPFQPYAHGEIYLSPTPPADLAAHFGLELPDSGTAQWRADPERWALYSACSLRFALATTDRHQTDASEGGKTLVGGFVQISTVSRRAIGSYIAHEWPDTVGELIDCRKGAPVPA